MSDLKRFRDKIYDNYVSSGQAMRDPISIDPEIVFKKNKNAIKQIIKIHFSKLDRELKILDIACGSGPYVHYLKTLGFKNILGVDGSKEQIELAHKIGISDTKHCDLFEFLRYTEVSYDVVLLMDILEHLTKPELIELMDQVVKVLKKGGQLIIHVPNAEGILGNRVMYADLTHENFFTPVSINQLLKLYGFEDIRCFEDKPSIHSMISILRRGLWSMLKFYYRLLHFAESANTRPILSQNMSVSAIKSN